MPYVKLPNGMYIHGYTTECQLQPPGAYDVIGHIERVSTETQDSCPRN